MTSFTFEVAPEVFERFPGYIVGCVVARGLQTSAGVEPIGRLLADAVARSRISYDNVDLKSLKPFEVWREAISRAGWSASRFPASVEALHRRVQRGNDLPSINPVVDLANSAVLFYSVPIGTHDIASLAGEALVVRLATDQDRFIDMSGDADPPSPGEIVYVAGNDVRTRRWVWRQSRDALVGATASDVFFPVDGFASDTLDGVEAASSFLEQICSEQFGAAVSRGMVSAGNPGFTA
jgi:DNA/RNA-binding domain of Phe-tRNA-synthetase-like protein